MIVAVVLVVCMPGRAHARRRMPPQFVSVDAGYGLSSPTSSSTPGGEGGYAKVEYYLQPSPWFSPRAYAGLLVTFPSRDSYCDQKGIHCDVSAKIGLLGVKGRLTIPIPYVAPFLELGVGTSVGAISTKTELIHKDMAGVTYHFPLALGVSLGEDHNFDLQILFYFHPSEKQANGGIGLGFCFQIK